MGAAACSTAWHRRRQKAAKHEAWRAWTVFCKVALQLETGRKSSMARIVRTLQHMMHQDKHMAWRAWVEYRDFMRYAEKTKVTSLQRMDRTLRHMQQQQKQLLPSNLPPPPTGMSAEEALETSVTVPIVMGRERSLGIGLNSDNIVTSVTSGSAAAKAGSGT